MGMPAVHTTLQCFFREQAHKLLPPCEQGPKLQLFTFGASSQKELGASALLEAASVLMSIPSFVFRVYSQVRHMWSIKAV